MHTWPDKAHAAHLRHNVENQVKAPDGTSNTGGNGEGVDASH